MIKGARERLNETLTFLQGLNMGPAMSAPRVAEVHAFVAAFVNRRFPVTSWYRYNGTMRTFSEHMSLGLRYHGAETNTDRKRRRAIYLLRAALKEAGNQAYIDQPRPREYVEPLATLLLDEMWRACLVWGQVSNNQAPHTELLRYMRTQPTVFLSTNLITIRGSAAQAGGPAAPTDLNVQAYRFQYNPNALRETFEFIPQSAAGLFHANSLAINAASVCMVNWFDVPNRGPLALPPAAPPRGFDAIHGTELGGGGVSLMLTAQFSGCSFCIKSVGGRIYAAHISPTLAGAGAAAIAAGLDGPALARQLDVGAATVAAGNFANAAAAGNPFLVYGRGHSNMPGANGYPLQMVLFGFHAGGGVWRIYSQHRNARVITDVVRIYP